MLGATLKSLFSRKFRLVMSALSIVLGIAFVAGSLMFTNMLSRSFDSIVKSTVADVNVIAERMSFTDMGTNTGNEQQLLGDDVVQQVEGIDGVEAVAPVISSTQMYLLDVDGKLVAVSGAPGIGINWNELPAADGLEGMRVVDGKAPAAAGEVAIDPSAVERSGHKIGDTVQISTPLAGIQEMKLVGTATYGDGATVGSSYLFFSDDEARRLMQNDAAGSTGLWIQTAEAADQEQVTTAVGELLPEGWEAKSGDAMGEELEEQLDAGMGFINTFLLVFAGIALLIATLLILNTFAIIVLQRSRELALYRALGASKSQVRATVLVEALLVAIVGTALGIAAGYGIVWGLLALLSRMGMDMGAVRPALTWTMIGICFAIGIVVTLIAALVPSFRAGRTRPIEAMTAASLPKVEKGLSAWTILGIVLVEVAIALIVIGVFIDVPQPLAWVGGGAGLMLIGAVLAVPVLGLPVIWLFSRIYRGFFGQIGKLAELNSKRQPGRTAATAATLVIGLTLVTTVAVLAASVTASMRESLTADQRGDYVIDSVVFQPFAASVAEEAAAVEGVERAVAIVPGEAVPEGQTDPVEITGIAPADLADATATEITAGAFTDEPDSAVISEKLAHDTGLSMGQLFDLTGPLGTARVLVTGVATDASNPPGQVIVHPEVMAKVADMSLVERVVVFTEEGSDAATVSEGLKAATTDNPTVVVTDINTFVQDRIDQFEQIVAVLYALLGLALVISLLGIVNTLSLSVIERTREIGLLRAVGVSQRQVRRMITLESILVTVMGATLGVLLGLLFGVLLQRVNEDLGIQVLDVPWVQLVLFVLVAALFGWLAAIIPARRAAKLPVLQSIAED